MQNVHISLCSLADPRGPNSFIFMQFLAKKFAKYYGCWCPLSKILDPPLIVMFCFVIFLSLQSTVVLFAGNYFPAILTGVTEKVQHHPRIIP